MNAYQQIIPMSLGWLDNNQAEQEKIKELLNLLHEKGTLDEIGIGTIRDAFSNMLFPGITTIQTRAKYLVILLYIFQEAYDNAKDKIQKGFTRYSRQQINQFIANQQDELVKYFDKNEDGVIGKRSGSVARKPTYIYWSALRTFNMVNPTLTYPHLCDMIIEKAAQAVDFINETEKTKRTQKRKSSNKRTNLDIIIDNDYNDDPDAFMDSDFVFYPPSWNYTGWRKNITMKLTHEEASFIKHHILNSPESKDSALAQLLKYYSENNVSCNFEDFDQIPHSVLKGEMKAIYQHAKQFRQFIYGAHLAYYYRLSNQTNIFLKKAYNNWKQQQDFNAVNLEKMLAEVKTRVKPNRFSDQSRFLENLLKFARESAWNNFESCIIEREERLKGARKKIGNPGNDDLKFDNQDSISRIMLDFRAYRAGVILKDILNGLS